MKKIGIKLADGSFHPILSRNDSEEKELVLTTIKDNQRTVKVNLYASDSGTIEGATHLDTLQITNLRRRPEGDPNIVLKMRMENRNTVSAELHDRESGLLAQTTISLIKPKKTGAEAGFTAESASERRGVIEPPNMISERKVEDISISETVAGTAKSAALDFSSKESEALDLQEPEAMGSMPLDYTDFSAASENILESEKDAASETYTSVDTDESKTMSKGRIAMWICIVCALICIIAVLLFLFLIPSKINILGGSDNSGETANDVQIIIEETAIENASQSDSSTQGGDALLQSAEHDNEPAMAAREDEIVVIPQAELVLPELPRTEEKNVSREVSYRLKWGDTLWDLAGAYYKNPWLYLKIARYNNIQNPNLIIAGAYINIPDVVSY